MAQLILDEYMELNRKPTREEERLIDVLIKKSSRKFPLWKYKIIVSPMNDGGMGSLTLFQDEDDKQNRIFGKQISEYRFIDEDGIEVIASLNIDDKGDLYELDIWKTDFSPLIRFPDI